MKICQLVDRQVRDMKRTIAVNNASVEKAGITKEPAQVMCEYIWNGFEANATKVAVNRIGEEFKEAMAVEIVDNGQGINFDMLDKTFGTFMDSLKNADTIKIRAHNNRGKGRFAFASISTMAKWHTIYSDNDEKKEYEITVDAGNKNEFDPGETIPKTSTASSTGTTINFPIADQVVWEQLSFINVKDTLLEEFAWFLYMNNGYSLVYFGNELDISEFIDGDLSQKKTVEINQVQFNIDIIVWKKKVKNYSKIFYTNDGLSIVGINNTSFNQNTIGFSHAVYVRSPFLTNGMFMCIIDEDESLCEDSANTDEKNIIRQLRKIIKKYIAEVYRNFVRHRANEKMLELEQHGSYPDFDDDGYGHLKKKDFERVTKELYCAAPKIFLSLRLEQEKSLLGFLNLLLSSKERENVLIIIDQIYKLDPVDRAEFASVLRQSKLKYIIEAISMVQQRAARIEHLKTIVFEMGKYANERDHVQRIIENNFWLFGEQYHLLTADKNMKRMLEAYEQHGLNGDSINGEIMSKSDELQRADLFLYTQRMLDDGCSEMLIVELKAPCITLSLDVYNQVVRYANTIKKDDRFVSQQRIWRLYAICKTVDDDIKEKYNNFEQHRKKGLIEIVGTNRNFEIYALTWDDIFQAFEARNSFLLERLKLDYAEIAKQYGLGEELQPSRETANDLTELIAIPL